MPPPNESAAPTAAAAGCPYHLGPQTNPLAGPMVEETHAFLARLRKEEPVTFNPALNLWFVSRYDDICEVLRDPARYSSAPMLQTGTELTPEARDIIAREGVVLSEANPITGSTVLCMDPPEHTRLRRVLNRGFTPARVAAQEGQVRRFANEIVDAFHADGRAELVSQFATQLPLWVILTMVGVPREDLMRVKLWTQDWFTLLFTHVTPENQLSLARSVAAYQRYCLELIEQRRRQPGDDLLSALVHPEPGDEPLTTAELIMCIQGSLLAAGHESTIMTISSSVARLLSEPGLWQTLQRERGLIPKFVEECIRYDGVIVSMFRATTQEVELGGVKLPKGAVLTLLYLSGNRDERQHPEADRFNLHREKQAHLTFGRFTHFCPGAPLARLELQVAVDTLLERLPTLRLAPHHRAEYSQNMVLRGLKSLHVEW